MPIHDFGPIGPPGATGPSWAVPSGATAVGPTGATGTALASGDLYRIGPPLPDHGWHTSVGYAPKEMDLSLSGHQHPEPVPIIELALPATIALVAIKRWRRPGDDS